MKLSLMWPVCKTRHLALVVGLWLAALLPASAFAGVPSAPLHWAKPSFADDGQAIETLTIRAAKGAHDTFIRFAVANAGFQKGELTVTFRQESPSGTMYGKETFPRGKYTVSKDKLGVVAGKNTLKHEGGKLVLHIEVDGVVADCVLSASAGPISAKDSGNGYILRELLVPVGKLAVKASKAEQNYEGNATAFLLHEASTAPAHKTYQHGVQMHNVTGAYLLVDYVVLPKDRGSKVLGFVVVAGKGKTFVGQIVQEQRTEEKKDGSMGYEVPWKIVVEAKRGEHRAAVELVASKQEKRNDELANLPWAARKAVGAVFHPVSYTLKASAKAEVLVSGATEPQVVQDNSVRYRYSQTN